MSHFDKSEASESDIKEELRHRLLRTIELRDLADHITDLLKARGKKQGTHERVGAYLASELRSKFAQPNKDIEQLIEKRPRQLYAMLEEIAVHEEFRQFIKAHPQILQAKPRRVKIVTEEERQKRTKAAKNRYEQLRRAGHIERGRIEQEFGEPSLFGGLLDKSIPWGPCLDNIFHGGRVKMCDHIDSMQSLFGLSRKQLVATPAIRHGREFFYDYQAVLNCMNHLLEQSDDRALWLRNPERRRTVLTGILVRAKQKALPKIADAFEQTLLPYLN